MLFRLALGFIHVFFLLEDTCQYEEYAVIHKKAKTKAGNLGVI